MRKKERNYAGRSLSAEKHARKQNSAAKPPCCLCPFEIRGNSRDRIGRQPGRLLISAPRILREKGFLPGISQSFLCELVCLLSCDPVAISTTIDRLECFCMRCQ